MLNIYSDSDQAKYWLSQSNNLQYTLTKDTVTWEQSFGKKVAFVEVWNMGDDMLSKLIFLQTQCELLVVIVPEFISDKWIRQLDCVNVVLVVSGILNYHTQNASVHFCPYFFWSTADFYRTRPDILELLHNQSKTRYFDILLGRRKPHRDIVYSAMNHNKNIVRYFPTQFDDNIATYKPTEFEWPTEIISERTDTNMTAGEVTVNGVIVSLSQIIPVNIYNQTWYSFVAETVCDNDFSFFTEKIVKPMLAKRIFVVAAGQYYLRNLRKLGFKTFNGIIDESYDEIADHTLRIEAACAVANKLIELDPTLIYSAVADILEHNYKLILQVNWQEQMAQELSSIFNTIQ